jgi:cytochrome c oxidase assembly factor CtaG
VGDHVGASVLRLLIVGAPCALAANPCAAHVAWTGHPPAGFGAFGAGLGVVLVASGALYARGVARLWRKAGVGRGIGVADASRFALGLAVLVAALLSSIDEMAERSFAVHMIEHEMLMIIAAPLLALARPLEAWAWGLSQGARWRVAALVATPAARRIGQALSRPVVATAVHALALWLWHLPALFAAAQASPPLHVMQHLCFFGSALAFWWAMFGGPSRVATPVSLACLFTTMLHTSVLGALLAFAPAPAFTMFPGAGVFGLGSLQDQQLGGLIMWVPGGLAYIVAALLVAGTWLAKPRLRRSLR